MRRRTLRSILPLAVILIATSGALAAEHEHGPEAGEGHEGGVNPARHEVGPDLGDDWGGYWWWSPGWYGPAWYDPLWYGPSYYYPRYPARIPHNLTSIVIHAHPSKADVYLDGTLLGRARDFDSVWDPLLVKPGEHQLRFAYPGYETLTLAIDATHGMRYTLHERLHEGQGIDPRSSEVAGVRRPAHPKG